MRKTCFAAALLGLALAGNQAHALFGDDEARKAIVDLRAQVQSQQAAQMQMLDRLDKLTKEVQMLRGQVEVLNNSYGKQQDLYGDLSTKIKDLEPGKKAAQAAQDQNIAAQQAFDEALKQFNKGNYDQAIKGFTAFGQRYGRNKLYPDSLYWLGSSYYGKGQFAKAIETQNRLISSYPRHAKVPEAMLVLGTAQIDAKKPAEGKATLQKLVGQYPKSDAAKVAKSLL